MISELKEIIILIIRITSEYKEIVILILILKSLILDLIKIFERIIFKVYIFF